MRSLAMILKSESPATMVAESCKPSVFIWFLRCSEIWSRTVDSLLPSIRYYCISLVNNLHENPMLIAVSILSPVRTQTRIPA